MRQVFTILFILTLLGVASDVVNLILVVSHVETDIFNFQFTTKLILRSPGICFWIWSLVICYKKDKGSNKFPLILVFPIYSLFYYKRIMKNNWLK